MISICLNIKLKYSWFLFPGYDLKIAPDAAVFSLRTGSEPDKTMGFRYINNLNFYAIKQETMSPYFFVFSIQEYEALRHDKPNLYYDFSCVLEHCLGYHISVICLALSHISTHTIRQLKIHYERYTIRQLVIDSSHISFWRLSKYVLCEYHLG